MSIDKLKDRRTIESIKLIEREQSRRKRLRLTRYNTGERVHHKQLAFHMATERNRWVFGGNRSGKTECGAVETVWLLRGIHPYRPNRPNASGWCVSVSQAVQRDVAQKKVLSYIDPAWIEKTVMLSGSSGAAEFGIIDCIYIRNVFGGLSRLGFKSCEQGREKFQGTDLDFVWFDEEPPQDIYEECKMRLLDRSGDMFGTMTPLKGLTWVHELIYLNPSLDPEIKCFFMEWADNPFLPSKEIAAMTSAMSSEALESRRYGRFHSGSGLVYSEFDPDVNVIKPFDVPTLWQDKLSIDPGLNNPLSCHWYAVDGDGNIYVVAEHYEANRDIAYHARRIKEISRALNWKTENGRLSALIDSAAQQVTLSGLKSVCELFYEEGIAVNPKVNKDLFTGINRVKAALKSADGVARLFIFENCVNLITEIKGYRWSSGDSPKKMNDHAMDELRYYIMSRPQPNTASNETIIVRDKKRLVRLGKLKRK